MNSASLFDTEGKTLSVEQLIEVIDYIAENEPVQYIGKGNFERMIVHRNKGLEDNKLVALINQFKALAFPQSYLQLLKYSNGLRFFEYDDIRIFPFQEALEDTGAELLEKKLLHFASCREDYFYLKCDGSERNIYYSVEGIEEPCPLNMSLLAFMEAGLISGFSYFWLWGKEDYDLF